MTVDVFGFPRFMGVSTGCGIAERSAPVIDPLMHWECPVCEFDDGEAGYLLPDGDHWCPMCAEDNGRDTRLRMTRIAESDPVTSANQERP